MSVKYPDVPLAIGVPAVFRLLQGIDLAVAADTLSEQNVLAQDEIAARGVSPAVWGIYNQDGSLTIEPDSYVKFEPRRSYRTSDFPVEGGGFQTYNKVQKPQEIRVTITKGGSDADRAAFLQDLDALLPSVDLFNLVTPDSAFVGFTLTDYEYSRAADRGITLLTIELDILEVRQTAVGAFSKSKEASGTDPVDGGPVRAATPTVAQLPRVPELV